ncbi:MAG TPA: hypothetical protein VGL86_03465 [Polyangia bacterium]|jgi:hypothetical protein
MRASILPLAILLAGCGPTPRPPDGGGSAAQEILYLVHNDVWRIGADGSDAARLGTVGDDGWRTGFPRRLADGQLALLADDVGAIYPYLVDDGQSRAVGPTNVTIHDALCGALVGGAAALVYTVTQFDGSSSALMRADPGSGVAQAVAVETGGELSEPSPWDDGSVLAVRSARGAVTVEILDVTGTSAREVLATIDPPYSAHGAARLPDGRVVFIRTDPRDLTDTAVGELFVLDRGGVARTTGITGVLALVVAGDDIVYEEGGADGVTDLVRTDLVGPPVNLTRTQNVAEHLGWSDSGL